MNDIPTSQIDPAIESYDRSAKLAADNLRKLISDTISDPGFDLFSFAHLLQQAVEGGNPMHSVFSDKIVRAAKVYVRASELFSEAMAGMLANLPVQETDVEDEIIDIVQDEFEAADQEMYVDVGAKDDE